MGKPPKIGYLVPQFPGQTHIFFWHEIKALKDMDAQVRLISTTRPPSGIIAHDWSAQAMEQTAYLDARFLLPALKTALGLDWRALWQDLKREKTSLAKDVVVALSAAGQLKDLALAEGLDHIHVHSCARAALIAAFARQAGGVPYSLTLHGDIPVYGPGQRPKWRDAAFGTVITRKLERELRDLLGQDCPDRLIVQPMGVDVETLKRDAPYEPWSPGQKLRLFSCGRLNPVKGHDILMQAVRRLIDQGIDTQLIIAGEDDAGGTGYRQTLESERKNLGLRDQVTFLGAVDATEIRRLMTSSHIFALASWAEALGVVYMEAMACGLPVVAVRSGGVDELIEDGQTGVFAPPHDAPGLAHAILRVAKDPQLAAALSVQGRAHVIAGFSAKRGAEVLLKEIRKGMGD